MQESNNNFNIILARRAFRIFIKSANNPLFGNASVEDAVKSSFIKFGVKHKQQPDIRTLTHTIT